jgi:SNF2 family DNA or RNA helicase
VFNWLLEAERFTPTLRMWDYTGLNRSEMLAQLDGADVLVTTYGILRRDIVALKALNFDYAILDEAQAIKNADSQAAKASRLLQAEHRLALTGTPVENHLGDLWSLFEFLNPGMLGRSSVFQQITKSGETQDDAQLNLLSAAIRPVMLRRTKAQVLRDLPDKTEQTLVCDLPPAQRQLYDELRDYYRTQLSERVQAVGLKRSKIQILEALLRLRQAACHPGLIDPERTGDPSAKLDALLEQLEEVIAEGHKALVFSQFTSLLAIVRQQLDKRGKVYAYLDGRTRKRQERVERFQQDPACPLFLISLKAGGHGLNLTAAEYVFILDPWWNPAVEAQAIDRAHRIGQTRPVFAYRLISRDTVEDKIVALQQSKRELAESIVSADANLMRHLTAEDLQLLIS